MKKFLISILAALSLTPAAVAQDYLFDNPDNHRYLGVRLNFDIMSLQSPANYYNNRGGLEIGVVYNMPLWKNLFFEPGASIFYNSAGISGISSVLGDPSLVTPNGTINNWGIRIPLNVGYHFDITDAIQVIPFTGPQISINLSNKESYNRLSPTQWAPSLHYNAVDLGWNFGIGVQYQRYYIGISGTVGISRYVADKPEVYAFPGTNIALPLYARRNLAKITLGYNF